MPQTVLGDYAEPLRCRRCGRRFASGRALNIHLTKRHAVEEPSPRYYGEGILSVETYGEYKDLRIRIKRQLWDGIEKCAKLENMTPEEAVIASLVSITTGPAWWFTGAKPSTTPVI